ncbi:hypothetical protein B0J11DRAFT_512951 [Dendryphion nanum]|uniref:FAD/NAD(P)-binding domain-containing protein n=1 Tax=Dendryphion nanum TaxID=256645 RepID=A0A9P9I7I1_9PLEO|nr:hypothetical protein B0J11DRAFT_512951 [Dendryphion nanum]
MSQVDIAIIGGGPAGLTAAATLARQLHTTIVFDSGLYRNDGNHHIHTVPGFEHKDPRAFRDTTRSQLLDRYRTIQFRDVGVTRIEKKSDSSFTVTDANDKTWEVKKVILGIGSTDVLPDIEGYKELWKKKIYHCLFCLGYESHGAPTAGVLAVQASAMMPALAIHSADNAAQLAKHITIYTNGSQEVHAQLTAMLPNSPFQIESRAIARLASKDEDEVTIEFSDGTTTCVSFLVHNPLTTPQGPFVQQLGLQMSPMGDIQADAPFYQTTIKGVFAAGDCVTPFKVIPHAIASGNFAAVAAATQIQAEKYGHISMV